MKLKVLGITIVLTAALLAGCGAKSEQKPTSSAPAASKPASSAPASSAPAASKPADAVTSASVVNAEDAFLKAISKDGTWIIATLRDMKFDKELVLDGTFKNGKKDANGNEIIQRKIALYTQDEKRNVTARFTLTAPKLTVNSPNARIQSGTFKGDIYVNAKNFELVDAKVEGNIYFASEEIKSTFKKDDKSSVTGKIELKK